LGHTNAVLTEDVWLRPSGTIYTGNDWNQNERVRLVTISSAYGWKTLPFTYVHVKERSNTTLTVSELVNEEIPLMQL
jgi:hypothetical protein